MGGSDKDKKTSDKEKEKKDKKDVRSTTLVCKLLPLNGIFTMFASIFVFRKGSGRRRNLIG